MTDHSHEALAHKADPSLDRLLFFSDGVFAIAITLLAIELHPPHGWNGTWAMLWGQGWPMLSAFALSFIVLGVFWNAHRRLFLRMTRFTNGVFVLNLLLLGGIALMPFATVLLYSGGGRTEAFGIYLALVSAIGVLDGLIYGYAAFVADVIRPHQHWMLRLSALTLQALMPVTCCALSLSLFRPAPAWLRLVLMLALAGLVLFRMIAVRRFGASRAA